MSQSTITVTTKGTFTLPAYIRKEMGVNKKGDRLAISFDKKSKKVTISPPGSFDFAAIQARLAPYVKNKKPLLDVSGYYNQRKPRI